MANFDEASLTDLVAYRAALKKALHSIKQDEIPFVYSAKHSFTTPAKKAPLFIVERSRIDAKLTKLIKSSATSPLAEGTCYYTEDGSALVLEVTKGKVAEAAFDVDGIAKVVVRDSGSGKVAEPSKPIGMDKNVGGNPIDLDKSKLEQFGDVLRRQQAKLDAALVRIAEIAREQQALKDTLAQLSKNKPATDAEAEEHEKFKAAVDAATDLKLKLSGELSVQNKIKALAEGVIKKAASARTDEEKADFVFADDRFGKAIKALEDSAYQSMMATNDAVMVLGRTSDTWKLQLTPEEQGRTLAVDPSLYTLTANDAFMKSGLDIKARFQLVTGFSKDTVEFMRNKQLTSKQLMQYLEKVRGAEPALWDSRSDRPAVSAREVGQLLDDGYWFGIHTDEKNQTVQMMFPRAVKPGMLEELQAKRKEMKA